MMSGQHGSTVLCIDLGKTSSRVVLVDSAGVILSAALKGVAANADVGTASVERIVATIALLPIDRVRTAVACGVGAAGTLTNPSAGQAMAFALQSVLRLPVAVTSDIITAHIGAFGGSSGVALVAGTGAVAVSLNAEGDLRRIDGWGPDIGDLGGGSWIGREGFRAVLGSGVGLCPTTALGAHLDALTSGIDPVRWAAGSDNSAQLLASFAPAVLDEAQRGDAVALKIVEAAIAHLCATASAAAIGMGNVAVMGGLSRHRWFSARLYEQLSSAGMSVAGPAGDALSGARIAVLRSDLPHERYIHRA